MEKQILLEMAEFSNGKNQPLWMGKQNPQMGSKERVAHPDRKGLESRVRHGRIHCRGGGWLDYASTITVVVTLRGGSLNRPFSF